MLSDKRIMARPGVSRGNLILATVMVSWCVWYLIDAYTISPTIQNLIFILPASCAAVLFYVFIIVQELTRRGAEEPTSLERSPREANPEGWVRPVAMMIQLGLYVFLLPIIGFDIATVLLVAGGLLVLGERRPLFIITFAILFTGLVVGAFKLMLSLDMPTLLL